MSACGVADCDRPTYVRGWCTLHYQRWKKHRDPEYARPPRPACRADGCDNPTRADGLCKPHYDRRYYAEHRDYFLDHGRRRYAAHREADLAANRRWREANRDRRRADVAAWHRANPDAKRQSEARRRQAKRNGGSGARIPAAALNAKVAYWGSRCWICRGPWSEYDHVKPLAKGGPHILANIRPICSACNKTKKARWPLPHLTKEVSHDRHRRPTRVDGRHAADCPDVRDA